MNILPTWHRLWPGFFPRCSLPWKLLCIDTHQWLVLSSAFSPHRVNGGLLLSYLLELISLRIPWEGALQEPRWLPWLCPRNGRSDVSFSCPKQSLLTFPL